MQNTERAAELKQKIAELTDQIQDLKSQLESLDPDTALQPFTLSQLHLIDHGSIGTEFDYAMRRIYEHINRYPYRIEGDKHKALTRKLNLGITLTPELKLDQTVTAGRNSPFASLNRIIRSIITSFKITTGLPDFEASAIRLRTTLDKNSIVSSRFHPDDNDNEIQRKFDFDENDE